MDDVFFITARKNGKEMCGVLYSNSPPDLAELNSAGLENIVFSMGTPLSKAKKIPEPTLYLFPRSSAHSSSVTLEILRFDFSMKITSHTSVPCNQPLYLVLPPVTGEKAEELIYGPRAYIIEGSVGRDFPEPSVAGRSACVMLIIKPTPEGTTLFPDMKTLKSLGFKSICKTEELSCEARGVSKSELLVILPPANAGEPPTFVGFEIQNGSSLDRSRKFSGYIDQVLPQLSGSGFERLCRKGYSSLPPPPTPIPSQPTSCVRNKNPKKQKARRLG